jgi:hypothetical protein
MNEAEVESRRACGARDFPACDLVFFRQTAALSMIRPFFGQNLGADGWSTGYLRMTLDGKGKRQ